MQSSMAAHAASLSSPSSSSSSSHLHGFKLKKQQPSSPAFIHLSHALNDRTPSYNPLVFQAVRLLGPPARFDASKLKVLFMGEQCKARIVPRTYTLSHCDFTANLTLTISNIIQRDQLKGWYSKDDVVAEWTQVNGNLCLNVHCYVSGPNSISDLAAEFRYHIFSKELPLVSKLDSIAEASTSPYINGDSWQVLEAVLYGDADLFQERKDLMDAVVRVFFHSSSKKYNRVECWGPLKEAATAAAKTEKVGGFSSADKQREMSNSNSGDHKFWAIFQALFSFLL